AGPAAGPGRCTAIFVGEKVGKLLVGAARFELATPSPPDWCANRAALRSDAARTSTTPARGRQGDRSRSTGGAGRIAGPAAPASDAAPAEPAAPALPAMPARQSR